MAPYHELRMSYLTRASYQPREGDALSNSILRMPTLRLSERTGRVQLRGGAGASSAAGVFASAPAASHVLTMRLHGDGEALGLSTWAPLLFSSSSPCAVLIYTRRSYDGASANKQPTNNLSNNLQTTSPFSPPQKRPLKGVKSY